MPVRLLRLFEPAGKPVQLPLAVERRADRRLRPVTQSLRRVPGGVEGVHPGAVQLQDLGAMHQAVAAERDEIRLRIAPPAQRGGPLLRTADVEDELARFDHAAVDRSSDHLADLVGHHRGHRLVEQPHPVDRPPLGDTARPSTLRASVTRSLSPNRVPNSAASPAIASAPRQSPSSARSSAEGTSRKPRSGQSPASSSSNRKPRAIQPPAGAAWPPLMRTKTIHPAHATARRRSPRLSSAWCARSHTATLSSSLPTRYAAVASRWTLRAPATLSGLRRTARRTRPPTPAGRMRRPRRRPTRRHPTPGPSRRQAARPAHRCVFGGATARGPSRPETAGARTNSTLPRSQLRGRIRGSFSARTPPG